MNRGSHVRNRSRRAERRLVLRVLAVALVLEPLALACDGSGEDTGVARAEQRAPGTPSVATAPAGQPEPAPARLELDEPGVPAVGCSRPPASPLTYRTRDQPEIAVPHVELCIGRGPEFGEGACVQIPCIARCLGPMVFACTEDGRTVEVQMRGRAGPPPPPEAMLERAKHDRWTAVGIARSGASRRLEILAEEFSPGVLNAEGKLTARVGGSRYPDSAWFAEVSFGEREAGRRLVWDVRSATWKTCEPASLLHGDPSACRRTRALGPGELALRRTIPW